MFIMVEIVGAGVVRYVEIRPTVIVVVGPDALHAVVVIWIIYPGLLRNVFKRSVAAIAEQEVGFTGKSPRTALHRDASKSAGLVISAEFRQLVDIDVHIARHEKIRSEEHTSELQSRLHL